MLRGAFRFDVSDVDLAGDGCEDQAGPTLFKELDGAPGFSGQSIKRAELSFDRSGDDPLFIHRREWYSDERFVLAML